MNDQLCPECAHLVIRNYNVMPQRMWESDRQVWTCEHCGTRVVRYFQNSQWTEWRKL